MLSAQVRNVIKCQILLQPHLTIAVGDTKTAMQITTLSLALSLSLSAATLSMHGLLNTQHERPQCLHVPPRTLRANAAHKVGQAAALKTRSLNPREKELRDALRPGTISQSETDSLIRGRMLQQ